MPSLRWRRRGCTGGRPLRASFSPSTSHPVSRSSRRDAARRRARFSAPPTAVSRSADGRRRPASTSDGNPRRPRTWPDDGSKSATSIRRMTALLRVAIVGSGPAGFYAAGSLLSAETPLEVDMIERLPTPWGLVRLGVAPDHPKIKSVSRAFEKIAAQPGFRFIGNVEVGRDVRHDELLELYDAVVYSVGAQADRRMGIPGEDLPGSWAATEFVAWYNGHPDYQQLEFDLDAERAVVIGNGNVALDIARMLALTHEELAPTDATDASIAAIAASPIREIVVVGRRGPAQASFTTPELQEMGELAGADVVVDPEDIELDPLSRSWLQEQGTFTARKNVQLLREFANGRERTDARRRIVLR